MNSGRVTWCVVATTFYAEPQIVPMPLDLDRQADTRERSGFLQFGEQRTIVGYRFGVLMLQVVGSR